MKKVYLTFDEWSAKGYRILKGSKGARSDKGTIVFSQEQVWKPDTSFNPDWDNFTDYDYYDGDYWSLFN